jgi:uncharacterized membrane protein YdfJ with MMPL/SSD domain
MVSGVAMDYTLFLLSTAREHYDLSIDPHHAMRMALRTSGRVLASRVAWSRHAWLAMERVGTPQTLSAGFQRAVRPAIHTSNA